MNSVNSDGLKSIYFIQSADFQYAHIDLSKTTLLLGASGVGKTTIMRAVLFFYTMDDSMLSINTDSKKPFNQWYFKDNNSHIIYEYRKGENKYLFIVSASGKLNYTFVDISNSDIGVKELFLKNKTPANLQLLNENIQKNSLPNFHTTKKNEYREIFHNKDIDGKKIHQKSKINFALFNDIGSREEFAKTLSNIFATSRITSDNLKKTIVSLIENSTANIDLLYIKTHFNNYIREKEEIDKFERKIPQINKLADKLEEYERVKKDFKEKANQIKVIKGKSLLAIEDSKINMDKLNKKKSKVEKSFTNKNIIQENLIKKQENSINTTSNEIKKLTKKEQEYKNKNIDNLVIEHNQKSSYIKDLNVNEKKLDALTSTQSELKNRYKSISETLEKDKDSNILKIQKFKIDEDKKIALQKELLLENRDDKIEKETNELFHEKDILDSRLIIKNKEFFDIKIGQGKLENYPFNKENIDRYSSEIEKYTKELSTIEIKIIENHNKIEKIEKDILDIKTQLKNDKDKLSDERETKKRELFKVKEDIEKKLNFESNNLYGYINKSNLLHKQKIVTYLKDDILFSKAEFKINETNNSDTIFGISIDFKEKLENNYDQTTLLRQFKIIKTDIEKSNKEFIEKQEILVNNAKNETRKKDKARSNLYLDKKSLDDFKSKYRLNKLKSINNLDIAHKEAKKLKDTEIQRLNREYLEQEAIINTLDTQIINLTKNIKNIEEQIKDITKKDIADLKKKSKILIEKEIVDINNINRNYHNSIDKTNKEYQKTIKDIELKLDTIEKYNKDVIVYLEEYQDKIKNIPNLKEQLYRDNKILKSLEETQQKLKNDYKKLMLR